MPFGIDDFTFIVLAMWGFGIVLGVMLGWFPRYVKWNVGQFYVAEVYQERAGSFYMVARRKVGIGDDSFVIGKRQFIVPNPAPVVDYQNSRPVLHYLLNKGRPRHSTIGDGPSEIVRPSKIAIEAPPGVKAGTAIDTESRSVWLFNASGAIKQMIQAARGLDLKAMLPFVILAAATAFMIAFVIFTVVHPGLYPNPPPGYYYKACPIPVNGSHIIQGVTGC